MAEFVIATEECIPRVVCEGGANTNYFGLTWWCDKKISERDQKILNEK